MITFEITTPTQRAKRYTLEDEHLSVQYAGRNRFNVRIPYWNIHPTYSKSTIPREKTAVLVAKIVVWSFLPLLCAAIAIEAWAFWIPAVLAAIPCFVWGRRIGKPEIYRIIFNEDIDGGWAFDIEYTSADEVRVMEFVQAVEVKLKAFHDRRLQERKESDCPENKEDAAEPDGADNGDKRRV